MIVIVDYGVGNLYSIHNMLKKIGCESVVSGSPSDIARAEKMVLPGVGAFDKCMSMFYGSGLIKQVEQKVKEEKTPVLGICVGMQMMMGSSEEGILPGLSWVPGKVVHFHKERMCISEKVPNMGWLDVELSKESPVLAGLEAPRFYFAHSYHVELENPGDELICAHYGYDFTAGLQKGNIMGVQFHPEKSHKYGMKLLENFCRFSA